MPMFIPILMSNLNPNPLLMLPLMAVQVDKQWQGYTWPAYVAGTLGIVYAVIGKA